MKMKLFHKPDMWHDSAERRCLIHGLKLLLDDARTDNRWPSQFKDDYWTITVVRKRKNASLENKKGNGERTRQC
jgi:hypothetical protein